MAVAVIACDLDGTINLFLEKVVEVYNQRYQPPIALTDFKAFRFEECFSETIVGRLINIFNEKGFFEEIPPTPGALEVIERLHQNEYHIEIVTALPRNINPQVAAEKVTWVVKHLPYLYENITITKNKYLVKADMLVDDTFLNIQQWCVHHPHGVGFLINQPWNEKYTHLPQNAVRGSILDLPNFLEQYPLPFDFFPQDFSSWKI